MSLGTQPINAMTVDVEDYFQVQAFANVVDRDSWNRLPSHVEANTSRILEQFARYNVQATFFTLGWVADRFPRLIRDIVQGGHELASHGYGHQLVHTLGADGFRADLERAKQSLQDVGGVEVRGYRAPTFSIGPQTPWAFDVLAETGHHYSSSVYPVKHDLYGSPDSSREPYRPTEKAILEIPLTTLKLGTTNLPIAGGGYFRLAPYWLYKLALRRFHRAEGRSGIFYFHPWEIDTEQPRFTTAGRLSNFRHHVNIKAVSARLDHLLQDFRWAPMTQVFAADLAALGR